MSDCLPETKHPLHKILIGALILVILVTLAIRYARPIEDSDIFWQMSYGRYLIDNQSLMLDHTIFTWTPAENTYIYCAWITQIFLYLLYTIGGIKGFFILRYSFLLLFFLLVLSQARRLRIIFLPHTWLIFLIGLLMSYTGVSVKPEMFSFLFMTLLVSLWWRIKTSTDNAITYCYFIPLLMLIWVNSHAGFMFGCLFLMLTFLGEGLNGLYSPEQGLRPTVRRHFYIASVLSGVAIFITPYGWKYPVNLFQNIYLGGHTFGELKTISEYATIFQVSNIFHFVDYFVLACIILIILLWSSFKDHRPDWSVILTNVIFGWLYTVFLRTTFYWAPIFVFSCMHLIKDAPPWLFQQKNKFSKPLNISIIMFIFFIGGIACFEAVCRPPENMWMGFGIGYQNPVSEANYIRENLSDYKLGNDLATGGYLLWALRPDKKIFIDTRCFPFKEWYMDYMSSFEAGRDVRGFIEKYSCDVWCIDITNTMPVSQFLDMPEWKLAYYGANAAVFVRQEINYPEELKHIAADDIGNIKNFDNALKVLLFSLTIRDFDSTSIILQGMKGNFNCLNESKKVKAAEHLVAGTIAYYKRDYVTAAQHLEASYTMDAITFTNPAIMINTYLFVGSAALNNKDYEKAIKYFTMASDLAPKRPDLKNNAGVALLRSGNINEAINYFKEAVSIDPTYSNARKNLDIAEALQKE